MHTLARIQKSSALAMFAFVTVVLALGSPLLHAAAAASAPSAVAVAADPLVPSGEEAAKVATLQATWVSLTAEPSPTDGAPAPRCDHALQSLGGRNRRSNAAVSPVPGGSEDPFADRLWLYGGWNKEDEFGDSWTLDVAADPPKWSRIEYSADSDPDALHSRWGTPIAFLPDGVDSRDEGKGVTALLFGGTGSELFGDVTSFNFDSATFRTIEPQPAAISDAVPFPRGYTQWIQLPVGFGEGAEALAAGGGVDSGCFYLLGGHGAADGVMGGPTHIDWNDEWVFNLTARSWRRLHSQRCLANVTTCSDEQSLLTLLADASKTVTGAEGADPLDLTAPVRPADIGPTLERLAAAVAALNATTAGMQNDPASCQTSCAQYAEANSSVLRPPPLEGTRMATVGNKLFLFGGYSCLEKGVQEKGGEGCFIGSMWVLDYADMTWSRIDPPASSSDANFKNWPSRRCFNTLVGHEERGLVVVQGGFFQDSSGVAYYYSDSYAFDTNRMDFVPFTVRGIPPLVAWSAAAALRGDDMFLHGGCQGSQFYDQLMVLRIGLAIEAANCFASGSGLRAATAGVAASFSIQTLETKFAGSGDLSSANSTRAAWGANATYGTGLVFSAQLVTTSRGGAVSLMQAEVTERVNGSYLVSYTASAGYEFQLFVSLDGAQIPGSPFSLRVAPQPVAAPERSAASGWGVALVEKGAPAALRLQLADAFGNELADNSFLPAGAAEARSQAGLVSWIGPDGGSVLNVSAALGLDADLLRPLDFSLLNHQNGSFSLHYAAPADNSAFLLAVRVNGAHISGSPFAVSALDSVSLSHSVMIALIALSALVVAVCLLCGLAVARFRGEMVMRSSSPTFLFVLMAGSALSALSVVFLAIEGSDQACQAFHTLLSVGLVLGMAALLAKSHRVMRIFTARKLKVPNNLSDARLMIPTLGVALLMLLLNLLWIGLDPLRSELRPSAAHPQVLSFHSCASSAGQSWVVALLAVCGAVLLYGVYIAVSTGHVPEQFNESKLIAASVYNVFFCSLIVVPLLFFLGSSSDFLVGRVVLQAIVILWCSAFPVLALMAPKLLLLWRRSRGTDGDEYGANGAGSGMVSAIGGGGDGSNGTALHTGATYGRYGPRASIIMPASKRGSIMPSVGGAGISVMGQQQHSRRHSTNGGNVSLAPPGPGARGGVVAITAHSATSNTPMDSRVRADSVQQQSGAGAGGAVATARSLHYPRPSVSNARLSHGAGTGQAGALSPAPTSRGIGISGVASPTSGSASRVRDGAPQLQGHMRVHSSSSASVVPAPALCDDDAPVPVVHIVYSAPTALPTSAGGSTSPNRSASPSPPLAAVERRRLHVSPPAMDTVVPFEASPSTSASPQLSGATLPARSSSPEGMDIAAEGGALGRSLPEQNANALPGTLPRSASISSSRQMHAQS